KQLGQLFYMDHAERGNASHTHIATNLEPDMPWLEPTPLRGNDATLLPLSHDHASDLEEAAKDGELWNLWYTSVPKPQDMKAEIDRRLELLEVGAMLPFTVLDGAGSVVGMTTMMNVDSVHQRVEIGSTWYARRVQRSKLNTECKLLLMSHAFDSLECIAVEYRTSFFNQQSRRAIERLGAKLDGVLRNHQRHTDGTLRDTCVFSIIQSEWPTVNAHLRFLLNDR
ncbi:MAG: GNAT family N-acetyltransferase, partial [Rubripirellula sp.]